MAYSLLLKKQDFKFSSSHFTIFSEQQAEALHGHNYQLAFRFLFSDVQKNLEMAVDFNLLKKEIRKICESLDEKILIAEKSQFLKVQKSPHYADHLEVVFAKRHYCFPAQESVRLPLHNITTEGLARYVHEQLAKKIPQEVKKFSVTVFETAGQAASYTGN